MRSWWLLGVCGCSLYFGDASHHDGGAPPQNPFDGGFDPPPPDAPTEFCNWYVCRDSVVYAVAPTPVQAGTCAPPTFTSATPVETCQYGCEYTNFYQGTAIGPCASPPPAPLDCEDPTTCTPNATEQCGGNLNCTGPLVTGECTCGSDATWSCTPACRDTLCSSSDVQQAIVGTWTGTATPLGPGFPASPWQVTLTIGSDDTWVGTTNLPYRDPFYYGGGGGGADKLFVQAETALGAYGELRLFGGEQAGIFETLDVGSDHLAFTFAAGWLDCGYSFSYDLTRAAPLTPRRVNGR